MRSKNRRLWLSSAAIMVMLGAGACKHDPKPAVREPAPARPAPGATSPDQEAKPAPAEAGTPANSVYSTVEDYTRPALSTLELPSGLVIEELKIGDGAPVMPAATVSFHYRSKVKDGEQFDSTVDREGGPALQTYPLKSMMTGLRDGVVGMKVGGRRRLTIPSDQAFGWLGQKDPGGKLVVPPDSTVVFVVDIVDTKLVLTPGTRK